MSKQSIVETSAAMAHYVGRTILDLIEENEALRKTVRASEARAALQAEIDAFRSGVRPSPALLAKLSPL